MTKEEFCTLLQKELNETTTITPETNFKELDSYGSLTSLMVLQLVEDNLGLKLNPRSFRNIKTVNDIANEVGTDKMS
ncbi:acyl carrier protein [Bergeyella zoohelcum]|uniref:acyl carrier protein n=1 Tax=Bergeyella zoohelcum TaxID=1015 RepID=UPI002A91FBE7|nr:acyl carrier protein [Bergeyella zoohelcum]MDY6025141.1 acyl carrier protein [Bergeyella zoohelcum]